MVPNRSIVEKHLSIQRGTDQSVAGQTVGVSNSALFFERAFLIVEGESEANSLPILYRNAYSRSMPEDGIVLVNLYGNGSWKSILKLLSSNKETIISVLLDSDSQTNPAGALITPDNLTNIGFSPLFMTNQCFFIGTKEFEDSFSTGDLVGALNLFYPKADGAAWLNVDVDRLRVPTLKFSEQLLIQVQREHRNRVGKPEFSVKLAQFCRNRTQIPQKILDVFEDVRTRANY